MNLKKALKTVGATKLMFSSDHAVNIPVELTKYSTLLDPGPDLDRTLFGTAVEVFSLKGRWAER